ncbi:MAG TPA: MotA/TolQ/ExbB proton channel family protein [Chthoniobacterales bacterium]
MKKKPKTKLPNLPAAGLLAGALLGLAMSDASAMGGVESGKSLLDLYREGGTVMHLIALCSIATLSLGAYCGILIRRQRVMPAPVVAQLSQLMAQRDVAGAYEACKANPGPFTNALSSALLKANFQRDMYNKPAMENAITDECFREETRLMALVNYLNTFAVLAPMIGLLGTVSGMITSFSALTAGKAEATDLAKGIGEALICTGGGLLLAIPAMFLYFYFRGQASVLMGDVHEKLSGMLDLFTGEVTPQSIYAVTGEAAEPGVIAEQA